MAKKIEWYYHRNGCTACSRAAKFLGENNVAIAEQVPASRKLGEEDAVGLLKKASKLYVAKGKQLDEFKADSTNAEAVAAMLGPTGNLRAPTIVKGKTLIVGFNEDMFQQQLG